MSDFMDGARLIVGLVLIGAGLASVGALAAVAVLALGRAFGRWWRS